MMKIRQTMWMRMIGVNALLLGLFLSSCGDGGSGEQSLSEVQGERGFVGTVNGTDAYIALLAGESEAVVYVCNGDEGIFAWFHDPVDEPTQFQLTNAQGASVTATFVGETFQGNVRLADGTTHAFSAEVAHAPDAGLYRVMGDEAEAAQVVAGWILDNEGGERGALLVRSQFQPTPAFKSSGLEIDSVTYPMFQWMFPPPTKPVPSTPPGVPIPYPITSK